MSPSAGRPAASSDAVRRRLRRQPQRDTKPELAVRRAVWHRGLRYNVDRPPIPGLRRRADLIFPRARVAVYVDGCFWHQCPDHGTTPKANREWWIAKLTANVQRDRDTDRRLRQAGWTVVRIWEHEDPELAGRRVAEAVNS
ncbi:MAG: very short patch repair endonuclease [Acidimicrobiia bacterium]|nr:very short patch repair endonuclease [Acidimicrobiia bacterium]